MALPPRLGDGSGRGRFVLSVSFAFRGAGRRGLSHRRAERGRPRSYHAGVDWLDSIALGAGLAWASGIRLYLVLLLAGAMAHFGYLDLPPALQVLQHPLVLAASGVMALGEFLADKVPAFDSVWDAVHTFIRI